MGNPKSNRISRASRLVAHETQEHAYTIKDLFKTPQIRKLTFKMSYLYFCRFAAYYAAFIIDIEGTYRENKESLQS